MQDVGERVFRILAIGANSTAKHMQQMEKALQEN
jgi:hypothetical protein